MAGAVSEPFDAVLTALERADLENLRVEGMIENEEEGYRPGVDDATLIKGVDDVHPKNNVDDETVLVQPGSGDSSAPGESGVADSEEIQPGTVIRDRFVVESIIGKGGMGIVYRAKDLRKEENQDRDPYVALKVLSEQFRRNPTMVMALQREARKAQTLAHPSITTVYDFDRDADRVYITMEVLEGKPLDEVIAEHPQGMPKSKVWPLVRGLCLGLAYAHNKNIVHSDFKPGNVFLTTDNRIKILDFGIARAAPASSSPSSLEASDATQFDAGELGALTPSYASCEMWEGAEPHPSDDVYALAIVTYQLLTGHHPFDSLPAPRAKALHMQPKQINGLNRREWRAIQHGLAFDRGKRTPHAAEFLRELEGSSKLWLGLAASVLLLAGVSGYVVYQEVQSEMAARPAVPFAELPEEVQQKFTRLISEGDTLEKFGDVPSALSVYKEAYQLHPRDPEALKRLEGLLQQLTGDTIERGQARDLKVLDDNLKSVMSIDEFLGNRKALVEARDKIQEALNR